MHGKLSPSGTCSRRWDIHNHERPSKLTNPQHWASSQHHPAQKNQSHGHEIPLVTMQDQPKTVLHVLACRINEPGRPRHKTSCAHSSSYHPFPVSHCPNQLGATMTETTGHALPQQGSPAVSTDGPPSGKRRITQICSPTSAPLWYRSKGVLYRAKQ